jgi:hypothetical protein
LEDKLNQTSSLSTTNETFKVCGPTSEISLISSNPKFQNILNSSLSPSISTSPQNIFFNNVWAKKTLENIVVIPEDTQTKSN